MKVDFEWVEATNSIRQLKQALKALKEEGGYEALEQAVQEKIERLQPSAKIPPNILSPEEQKSIDEELALWADRMEESKQKQELKDQILNERRAEEEKTKGNDYIRTGDIELAIQCYDKAAKYNPQNAAIFCNRALAFLKQKKYSRVIADCEIAITLNPDYAKAYHRRGKAKMALNDFKGALEDFQKTLEYEPNDQAVNQDLQECRKHMPEKTDFRRVTIVEEEDDDSEEEPVIPEKQEQPDADSSVRAVLQSIAMMKQEGVSLYSNGQYDEALTIYDLAISELDKLNPRTQEDKQQIRDDKAALLNNKALCYQQKSLNLQVIEMTTSALNLEPSDKNLRIKALIRRGLANEKLEFFQAAKTDMQNVKQLDPSNIQASKALQRISQVLITEQEDDIMKQAVRTNEVLQQLTRLKEAGNDQFREQEYDKAIYEFTQAISLANKYIQSYPEFSENPNARLLIAQLYGNRALVNLKLDCNALVIQDCNEALKFEPNNLKVLYRLAKAHENCNKFEEAEQEYQKLLDLDQSNSQVKKELALLRKKIQESEKLSQEQHPHDHNLRRRVSFRDEGIQEIQETQQPSVPSPPQVEQTSKNLPKVQPKKKANISSETIQKATQLANSSLGTQNPPSTVFMFEQSANALRNNLDSFYQYLRIVQPTNLVNFYKTSQINPELLMQIIQTIDTYHDGDNSHFQEILRQLLQTSDFGMVVMFLSQGEKGLIRNVIEKLGFSSEEKGAILMKFGIKA